MSNLFWLTDAQMARLQPFFPKSHGKPRVDDRGGVERSNRHQSQWLALVRCAEGLWSAENPLQPLEAVERQGGLRPDDGWVGSRGRRPEDGVDRRDLS